MVEGRTCQTQIPFLLGNLMLATVSIPGVYGGLLDKVPLGAAFAKGLRLTMGQTHVHRYMAPLLARIVAGELDPSTIITHRASLDEAPQLYRRFQRKTDGCVKIVLTPGLTRKEATSRESERVPTFDAPTLPAASAVLG